MTLSLPRNLSGRLDEVGASATILACIGATAAVGVLDYATGLEVSVATLYLAPVAGASWRLGLRAGIAVALASAFTCMAADLVARGGPGRTAVALWNMGMLCTEFVGVAFALASLEQVRTGLEAIVAQRTKLLTDEVETRRLAEDDLRTANAELSRTQSKLVEAAKLETVGRMAAGVAHEVKNPLMTLSMGVDYFLQGKAANDDEAALLSDMKESVQRASGIINLMLDFSRPHPLQLVDEDMNAVVEGSLNLMRHQFTGHRVEVVRDFQVGLPRLPLDKSRLQHVFLNLFTNACHAMVRGGTLVVRTRASGTGLRVEIDDTGTGIPVENLGRLFEVFYTTKGPGKGTGLGLAICRKIVEIHGGTIHLSNRPEGGARAALTFNVKEKGNGTS